MKCDEENWNAINFYPNCTLKPAFLPMRTLNSRWSENVFGASQEKMNSICEREEERVHRCRVWVVGGSLTFPHSALRHLLHHDALINIHDDE
jgi:hypothetical protein